MLGIAIGDISDRFPVFALIPTVKHFTNNPHQTWTQDMKNFKADHFINQTINASLSPLDSRIHDQFEQFIHSFTGVVNKQTPAKISY